jgi:hypothetical protein
MATARKINRQRRPELVDRERLQAELEYRKSPVRRFFYDNGLSLTLFFLFAIFLLGQSVAGLRTYNQDQQEHGQSTIGFSEYLSSAHFWEATAENWESEFLQMFAFVVLTIFLYQKGSAESKRPETIEMQDADPRGSTQKDDAPWPVRVGGWFLTLYEHSLSIAFFLLFAISITVHAWSGLRQFNQEQVDHGQNAVSMAEYLAGSRFWFESMQNWQSEFLSIFAMVVLTIFLRQRYSPESKPVDAPHSETGKA